MKRKIYFMAGLAALAMLFAACSNLDEDASSKSSGSASRAGTLRELTLSLANDSLPSYRNIYPGDWTDGDQDYADDDLAKNLTYVLTGFTVDNTSQPTPSDDTVTFTDKDDATHQYKVFTYADLMKSAATVNLKPLIWRFTLTAYQTDLSGADDIEDGKVVAKDICLIGTAYADLTDGSKTIQFDMKSPAKDLESTATGTAEIGLTFTPPNEFAKVTYGFFKESETTPGTPDFAQPATDAGTSKSTVVTLLKMAKETPTTQGEDDFILYEDGDSTKTAWVTSAKTPTGTPGYDYIYVLKKADGEGVLQPTIITNTLATGTYWFRAIFYNDKNQRMTVYVDKIIIDGLNTSTGDIELIESAFNSTAKNISNLRIAYKFNDIEFVSDPGYAANMQLKDGETVSDTYQAIVTWVDNADNEVGYQLKLDKMKDKDGGGLEVDGESILLSPETEATTLTEYGLTASSLNAGVQTCTLTLKTGVRYQMKLRAYNDWSKSVDAYDATYDATAEATGYDRFVPYIPRTSSEPGADVETFGLYTITYNLNGGVIKQTSAKTTPTTTTYYAVPYIYLADNKLLGESDFPYIKRSGYIFVGWNELYGATGYKTTNNKKTLHTSPSLSADTKVSTWPEGVTGPGTSTNITIDTIVTKSDGTKITPTNPGGSGTAGNPSNLATYTWTIPVWKDNDKYYNDEDGTQGSTEIPIPAYALVSPTSTTNKYTYSNIMKADGELDATDYKNRELFATWETPLYFGITLPKYPDVKITKEASAGEPLVIAKSSATPLEINANDKLSNVTFTIYKEDLTVADNDILTDDNKYTTGVNVETAGQLKWTVTNVPAMTYYVKITADYVYPEDSTNSLSEATDKIEGYIYVRITN